jgi:hypothetical protein
LDVWFVGAEPAAEEGLEDPEPEPEEEPEPEPEELEGEVELEEELPAGLRPEIGLTPVVAFPVAGTAVEVGLLLLTKVELVLDALILLLPLADAVDVVDGSDDTDEGDVPEPPMSLMLSEDPLLSPY